MLGRSLLNARFSSVRTLLPRASASRCLTPRFGQSLRLLSTQQHGQEHKQDGDQNKDQHEHEQERTRGAWETYTHWLETYPLATKAVTSAVIVAAGDVLAQVAFDDATLASFNWKRLAIMATLGGCVIGPTLHKWYGFLGSMFPAATTQSALFRLVADQFVFAPCFIPVIFFVQFGLEGRVAELQDHLKATWWEATTTNWKLWLPAQFITFRYIPGKYQVLFVNGVAVVWNMYISWVGHLGPASGHEDGPL